MNVKFKSVLIVLFFITFVCAQVVAAQNLSSSELIENAKQYDGKLVVYSGEVIGDVMLRKENAWVNINDGKNALGIWMSAPLAEKINFVGNYQFRGDNLEITGIFHRACLEHGGDLDIHAQGLRKLTDGRKVPHKVNLDNKNLSVILFGILSFIWILILLKRK